MAVVFEAVPISAMPKALDLTFSILALEAAQSGLPQSVSDIHRARDLSEEHSLAVVGVEAAVVHTGLMHTAGYAARSKLGGHSLPAIHSRVLCHYCQPLS